MKERSGTLKNHPAYFFLPGEFQARYLVPAQCVWAGGPSGPGAAGYGMRGQGGNEISLPTVACFDLFVSVCFIFLFK